MNTIINDCFQGYSAFNQETGSYDLNWQAISVSSATQNVSNANVYNAFKYTPSSQIDSYSYNAEVNTYFGGGYVFKMIGNLTSLSNNIAELKRHGWIDKQTAAVFVELTLFNPNINLYQYCSIVFEILTSGNFVNSAIFTPLDMTSSDFISSKVLLGLAYLLCIVMLMVYQGKLFYKSRLSYFKHTHNYIDIIIIAFSWTAFSMFLYRLFESYRIFSLLTKKGLHTTFINFQYIATSEQNLNYFLAFCAAFVTLRFLKVLRFYKRIALFLESFKMSLTEIFSFAVLFTLFWLSFVQAIFLLMNNQTYEFSTLVKSMENCFQIMLGKFNGKTFLVSNSILLPILLSLYNLIVVFVLVNIFVSILIYHYNFTKKYGSLDEQNPRLLNYMWSKVKPWIFWRKESEFDEKKSEKVYIELLDSLPIRFDFILKRFNEVFFLNFY